MKNSLLQAIDVIPVSDYEIDCQSLSLTINEASIVSMVGPESSGKSLWLKTLIGFNALAQGELSILQHDVRQLNRHEWLCLQKDISYVGQDTALLSAYTLLENILLPALYHKLAGRQELIRQAYLLLDEIGFDDKSVLDQLPAFATPLQNYFVKIVRALIVCPRLLFLDDMYAHINQDRTVGFNQFLMGKVSEAGLSIVLTTSDVNQLIDDSSRIIFFSSKVISVHESIKDLLKSDDESIKEYLSKNGIH